MYSNFIKYENVSKMVKVLNADDTQWGVRHLSRLFRRLPISINYYITMEENT